MSGLTLSISAEVLILMHELYVHLVCYNDINYYYYSAFYYYVCIYVWSNIALRILYTHHVLVILPTYVLVCITISLQWKQVNLVGQLCVQHMCCFHNKMYVFSDCPKILTYWFPP
jgi:hypothetical protein